ncbi:hypothetical protein [Pseudodesulfovibrio sp.]|uniref:hypothetical protein n=1 Tax=unclassified Pseudodesulfovibrio TaxID=2661612 RepID=UPI003B00A9DD
MRPILLFSILFLLLSVLPATAQLDEPNQLQEMANSEFRIAQKAYRDLVKKYGADVKGMTAEEKEKACKKIKQAQYDNNVQENMESTFAAKNTQKQLSELNAYSKTLMCQ